MAQRFGFENVRSTVELAVPWFIGAAVGLQVLGTFSVGQRSFVVGGMRVARGSELDGLRMFELSTQTRVIAITRPNALVKLHPRRDARLHADDTVYLVGPYRELLDTLRKGRPPQQPAADAPAHQLGRGLTGREDRPPEAIAVAIGLVLVAAAFVLPRLHWGIRSLLHTAPDRFGWHAGAAAVSLLELGQPGVGGVRDRLGQRRRTRPRSLDLTAIRRRSGLHLLMLAMLIAIVRADLSMLSKAETERI